MLTRLLAFVRSLLGLPGPWRFAAVEIMGFRKHFGRARESRWLGGRFLDVEDLEREGPVERIRYGAQAIFSFKWLTDEEGKQRIEAYRERSRREEADRARWRADADEQERARKRQEDLDRLIERVVRDGWESLDSITARMAVLSTVVIADVAQAERAVEDAVRRGVIIEDPEGSGVYRLPTEDEEKRRDSIPF